MPQFNRNFFYVFIIDIFCVLLSFWISYFLRLGSFVKFNDLNIHNIVIPTIIFIIIFYLYGVYKIIFKYGNISSLYVIIQAISTYGFITISFVIFFNILEIPRLIGIIQPLILFFLIIVNRIIIHRIQNFFENKNNLLLNKKNILIYGAGSAGRSLLSFLSNQNKFNIIGFLDDKISIQGLKISQYKIYKPDILPYLVNRFSISEILLALPSISHAQRSKIISKLEIYPVRVRTIPNLDDLLFFKSDLRIKELGLEDILGREIVPPNTELLMNKIKDKVILVSGAGGSIGSELCRQIFKVSPKKIILIDNSEFNLYKISNELEEINPNNNKIKIYSILASVQNKNEIEKVFQKWRVDTVFHAAAYKHVPLVEHNIIEGIKNNFFGTSVIANLSLKHGVSDFTLISTDKAVRPTNIMGASKRLSELCIHAISKKQKTSDFHTNFSIVRFGNVIDSSGSVIPKFREQIKKGGPVTITHKDISRYFMTIPEAAQLVIQASSLTNSEEKCSVFVLDMGKPILIYDLAKRMILLSGHKVKNKEYPDGDIEIVFTGLRPGEKLYEELFIGQNPKSTFHKKIFRANDPFLEWEEYKKLNDDITTYVQSSDINSILNLLQVTIDYNQKNIVDYFHY